MPKYNLWPTQIEDLAFRIANPRWLDASDMGTGKTPPTVVWFEYLWEHKNVKTCFAGPKSLMVKNKAEVHKFTDFKDNEVIIIDGTPKQRLEQIKTPTAKVFIMGFTRFADDWELILEHHPEMDALVLEESHLGVKKHGSKRASRCYKAMKKFTYFGAMSGTFIDGALDSAYPVFRMLEPRYYSSHNSFMRQHAITEPFYNSVVEWTNHEKIEQILKKHSIRRTFEEVHGKELPFYVAEECQMFKAQEEAYLEMHNLGIIELEKDFLVADEPGVAAIRCNQLLAHPETFDFKGVTGKDEALKIHLENHKRNGEPLIIFSSAVPEQERIANLVDQMGLTVQLINGDSKNKDIDEEFRNGTYQVVVASPEVASVGYNWGHVNHIIFASVDYSDSNFTQAVGRGIRGKRETQLLVTILFYPHTIERNRFEAIDRKSALKVKVDNSYNQLGLTALIDNATSK